MDLIKSNKVDRDKSRFLLTLKTAPYKEEKKHLNSQASNNL